MKLSLPSTIRSSSSELTFPVGIYAPGHGFDLLVGGYDRIRRLRFATLSTIGFGTILVVYLGVSVLSAYVNTNLNNSANNSQKVLLATATRSVGDKLPGGISDSNLTLHAKARAQAAITELKSSFDAATAIKDIVSAAPAGLKVVSVQFTPAPASAVAAPAAPAVISPFTGKALPTLPTRVATTFNVSISIKIIDRTQVSKWVAAVAQLPFLSAVSSSNDDKTVTTLAKLTGMPPSNLANFESTWSSYLKSTTTTGGK